MVPLLHQSRFPDTLTRRLRPHKSCILSLPPLAAPLTRAINAPVAHFLKPDLGVLPSQAGSPDSLPGIFLESFPKTYPAASSPPKRSTTHPSIRKALPPLTPETDPIYSRLQLSPRFPDVISAYGWPSCNWYNSKTEPRFSEGPFCVSAPCILLQIPLAHIHPASGATHYAQDISSPVAWFPPASEDRNLSSATRPIPTRRHL